VIGEELCFCAVVFVGVSSKQSTVVCRDVEVFFGNSTGLATLVDEGKQLVETGLEVILPVTILRIAAIDLFSDLLFERVQTVGLLVNLIACVE